MGFHDLNLQRVYDTGDAQTDVLGDFYVPVLSAAMSYDRLSGYFSSTALALAARGIAGLIKNGGTMRLVASPFLSEADIGAISHMDEADSIATVANSLLAELDLHQLADEIACDHVRALGWMLAQGRLDIRILVPEGEEDRLFHQKVGILRDLEGNLLSFSGSVNETASGWLHNIEEFKVFRSWEPAEREWVNHDAASFAKYWSAGSTSGYRVMSLPDAVRGRLLQTAPDDPADLNLGDTPGRASRGRLAFQLRDYQATAVRNWFDADCRGVLEMATGVGKTKTAVACIAELARRQDDLMVVVTAPYQHIATQWQADLAHWEPVCTYESPRWRDAVANAVSDFRLGSRRPLIIIAVQNTAASDSFLALTGKAAAAAGETLFVGDEVHGLGAPLMRHALSKSYRCRLGLSATPQRWFDEEGAAILESYFGGTVFTFGIHEALTWVDPKTGLTPLCPYDYFPEFVSLDEDERERYGELSDQIVKQMVMSHDAANDEHLQLLLFKRAAIVKTASAKIAALGKILRDKGSTDHALIYCHSSDQMADVRSVLQTLGVRYHNFTGDEGTTASSEFNGLSEREWILGDLAAGKTQALIAMKCLDEGVDVPSAELGVILASSGNPREFIQRRGRLLRRAPGKDHATIYDVVVAPSLDMVRDPVARDMERRIFQKELERVDEFARDANNSLEAHNRVLSLLTRLA